MTQTAKRKLWALLGLALVLGPVLAGFNRFGEVHLGLTPLQSRDMFWWPMLAATLVFVLLIERRPLASIGLRRPTWMTLAFGLGAVALSFAIDPAVGFVQGLLHLPSQTGTAAAGTIASMPYWYRALLVTRAAFAEEVIFRGFAIERLEELTGSRIVAGAVSLGAFGFAHSAYWGWATLLGVGIGGLVLTVLYQWRRDLGANILAHFVIDAVSLLL